MFNASQLVFYYAISPVHMGAGSAIGAIDSPIQREVHTLHPMFAGSGLKGALRHHFSQTWPRTEANKPNDMIRRIFGPDTNASDHAGALSLTDAQLVALPVRSLKGGFAYVTSPLALARLQRLTQHAGLTARWSVPSVAENKALVCGPNLLGQRPGASANAAADQLILEAFEFTATVDASLQDAAKWIAAHALSTGASAFFSQKFQTDLVLLNDTDFAHFARHAMVVEPHVRINDESGTADDGGLFYVENLPPETLMVGLAQASIERYKKGHKPADALEAKQVLDAVFTGHSSAPGIAGELLQIGGDATTGRGLVLVQHVV